MDIARGIHARGYRERNGKRVLHDHGTHARNSPKEISKAFSGTERKKMIAFPKSKPTKDLKLLASIRKLSCVVGGPSCGREITVSHIKTVGSGGGDDWFNVTPKCLKHHIEWEKSAPRVFCQKYPHFWEYLKMLGWYFEGFRLRHPNLERGSESINL